MESDKNTPMSRGGIYYTRIKFVKEHYGKQGMENLYRRMREYGYDGPSSEEEIKIGKWYPHRYDLLFLRAFVDLFGEKALEKMASELPKYRDGVTGLFVKWPDDPRGIIESASEFWKMFYNFGSVEGTITGENEGVVRGKDVSMDPLFCTLLTNYFRGLVEGTGAKEVRVEHTRCVHRGDGEEEWRIRWKEGTKKTGEIKWSRSLETGIEEIDRQHRYFVKILNEINRKMGEGDEYSLRDILRFMDRYAHWHFQSEEKYMKEYGYPEYERHRSAHEQFYRYTKDMLEKSHGGIDDSFIYAVDKYLIEWLINHIMGEDRKFAEFIKKRGLTMEREEMPEEFEKALKSSPGEIRTPVGGSKVRHA